MNTLLEIQNVTKYFGSGDAVSKALNGVSFSMGRGGIYRRDGRLRLGQKHPAERHCHH